MIRFIENIGDYYSQHFFTDGFPKKVFDKAGYVTQKKDSDGNDAANHLTEINARISPLREKYYRFKNDLLNIQREKDKVKRTHEFHKELLDALGYINGTPEYNEPVYLNDTEVIPVRYNYYKGGKPYLFIMEMKAIVREGEKQPDGIYDQTWIKEDWEKVFPATWGEVTLKPDVIKEALSELFLLPEDQRPVYVVMLAGAKVFLIHFEKWKYDSFLLFDLEELFNESLVSTNRDYLALFYALLAKQNFLSDTDSLLQSLDEDAHKAAYGVTQNLKKGVIYAVESLANEAIWYKKARAKTVEEKDVIEKLMADEKFARELKDECLTMVYRLLFLFYAEAREDLEILPVKDPTYQKGYSLEMLRDLEMVPLTTDSSRNGYFISESLWKLFQYLHNGVRTPNGFEMKPLDSPLFDNDEMKHLHGVQFRNVVLQQIIKHLSLSDQSKGKRRGRISYGNLGINQLGSVYESLLAYSGFFASEPLIEVKAADDPDGKDGTFLVPLTRRDDFKEEEILKDPENPKYDKSISKEYFVYRLNGRDRKKSASYYTPEVLTQTTVKYTLKGIIDSLKQRQEKGEYCADEILSLKILEPAMGAAAFHNEVINQLADAYLELKEIEEVKRGRTRIVPGDYRDEMQKVKAFIAANNVYGVDLNPTAVELGKLSLWLNCMHRNMETPFFAHRLGTGNAVVGCWLKVYDEKNVIAEYLASEKNKKKRKPIPKNWWDKAPSRIGWNKKGGLTRNPKQFYHFLLPDENMLASSGIGLIKEDLSDAQKKALTEWKKDFKQPLTSNECARLEKLCRVIDTLLDEHYRQIKGIIKDTTSAYAVYGQSNPQMPIKGYDEKERLAESRNARSAPYYKLRMVMDYWCSLWFWDARDIVNLPSREQWFNEIENILGVDLSSMQENADAADILANIKKHAADTSGLFGSEERLHTVEKLREHHRFFHHELEFLEVFKERGGFDVIVGNPPWIKLQFEEKDVIAEQFPEVSIRKTTAPQVNKLQKNYLSLPKQEHEYLSEFIGTESSSQFLNAIQNYPLLVGQQTNLYKCVLENGLSLLSKNGFLGLLHPEGVYDEPNGQPLRREIYRRLKFHFQFRNELLLFAEVVHTRMYGIGVYSGDASETSFLSMNNLYHPSTIFSSFEHDGSGQVYGLKKKNAQTGKYEWNTTGHKNRIIKYDIDTLTKLKDIFGQEDDPEECKLVGIHSTETLSVLEKFQMFPSRLASANPTITVCFDETNDINSAQNANGPIKSEIKYPDHDRLEMVYSGPHFYVGNPIFRSPQSVVVNHSDFDVVDLTLIDQAFLPRTKYIPAISEHKFVQSVGKIGNKSWLDFYKIACSKMIDSMSERTLQSCILPKNTTHIHGVISVTLSDALQTVEFAGLTHSIVLDFYLKTLGSSNLSDGRLKSFPLGIPVKFREQLIPRVLRLNCITKYYSELWSSLYEPYFNKIELSQQNGSLRSYSDLSEEWNFSSTPLKNYFERRLALVEIDVIVAMAFGLSIDDLLSLYYTQFSVMQKFEEDTWYDQNGAIVFTSNSQGLRGVGVSKKQWQQIREYSSGQTFDYVIGSETSEIHDGAHIKYVAPFFKCERTEDYRKAWDFFDKVFSSN